MNTIPKKHLVTNENKLCRVDVIQWNEELYERILIDRTKDACKGEVDVVIDFGTTSRSLNRSIQCLSKGGVVFLGHETADRLLPKFSRKAEEYGITIQAIETGSLQQLKELVELVHSGKVTIYSSQFKKLRLSTWIVRN